MKKGKSKSVDSSQKVYDRLQSRYPRDLGTTLNGDHCKTPSNTFRPLETVVPESAMRERTECHYDPKSGKFVDRKYTDDMVAHAQHSIRAIKFQSTSSGPRQRRNEKLDKDYRVDDPHRDDMVTGTTRSPVPLEGKDNQFKRRY